MKTPRYLWQAVALSTLAGMRSLAAPALLSHHLSKHPAAGLTGSPLRFMQLTQVATLTKVLAAAEMTGDKMPGIPNRIAPAALAARAATGGLVGATLFKANQDSMVQGAVIGAAAAMAATFASFYLRKALVRSTGITDSIFGMLEDTLVMRSGVAALKS